MFDEYGRVRWSVVFVVVAVFGLGGYFVKAKVHNDSEIARDTKRAADALETIAGNLSISVKAEDRGGKVVAQWGSPSCGK